MEAAAIRTAKGELGSITAFHGSTLIFHVSVMPDTLHAASTSGLGHPSPLFIFRERKHLLDTRLEALSTLSDGVSSLTKMAFTEVLDVPKHPALPRYQASSPARNIWGAGTDGRCSLLKRLKYLLIWRLNTQMQPMHQGPVAWLSPLWKGDGGG